MRPATIEGAFPVPDRIVQLSRAFMGAKTLLSAVELGVFTVLAKGPLDLETLRKRTEVDRRGASDFFDALVALGLLEREGGRYANTPETGIYLDRGKPTYMGGELEHLNARIYEHWGLLTAALRTGQSQSATANGKYPALYANSATLEAFVKGMAGGSRPAATAMAAKFPWQDYKTVLDIGTAQGCLPVQIALAYGHIGGAGFDLPHVRSAFEAYVGEHHLSDRLSFHPGDFFRDPFPTPMCWSWAGCFTIGILRPRKCCSRRPIRRLPRAARSSSTNG